MYEEYHPLHVHHTYLTIVTYAVRATQVVGGLVMLRNM
jgi:hypothetical protein